MANFDLQQQNLDNITTLLLTTLEFPEEIQNLIGEEEREIILDLLAVRKSFFMAPPSGKRSDFALEELYKLYEKMINSPLDWMASLVHNLLVHEQSVKQLTNLTQNSINTRYEIEPMIQISKSNLKNMKKEIFPSLNNPSLYIITLFFIGTFNNYFIDYIAPELADAKIDLSEWPVFEEVLVMYLRSEKNNLFQMALDPGKQPDSYDTYQSGERITEILRSLKRGDNVHLFPRRGSRLHSQLLKFFQNFEGVEPQIHGTVLNVRVENEIVDVEIMSPHTSALCKLNGYDEVPNDLLHFTPDDVSTIIVSESSEFKFGDETFKSGEIIYYFGLSPDNVVKRYKAEIVGGMGGWALIVNIAPDDERVNNTITARRGWEIFRV